MNLCSAATDCRGRPRPVCLAIGVFDGVHLGHQQVIRQMVTDARQHDARSIVITFDRHPNAIVAPARVPPLIYSLPQKLRAIASLGVDTTLLIHFDDAFSRQTGEEFIRGLSRDLGRIHSVCVGSTFTFGHRRSGNVALLQKLGQELGFAVHGLAAISLDGEPVSSTRIREAVRNGQLDLAGQMLGRGYSLAGPVMHGDHLGRQLGFPTANVDAAGLILPPTGVYAVHAQIYDMFEPRSLRAQGLQNGKPQPQKAVVNIGYRPTLKDKTPQLRVEAHLLDFDADLYGRELELTFVDKIRDEQPFPSLAALKDQIALDIVAARTRF